MDNLYNKVACQVAESMELDDLIQHCTDSIEEQYNDDPAAFFYDVFNHWDEFVDDTEFNWPDLAREHGARLVQAQEPEVLGRWDWIDDGGQSASDASFETEREAAINFLVTLYAESLIDEIDFS